MARPAIAFDMTAASRVDIDASAVHVFLDGRDISAALAIEGSHVSYVPAQPLSRGSHTVEVQVDEPGGATASDSWNFVVNASETQTYENGERATDSKYDNSAPDEQVGFYAAASVPYYTAGSYVRFIVTGPYGGHGYVVFPGLSGRYPLIPYAPGYYYVIVFVPVGYAIPYPPIACRFFAPGGRAYTIPLNRPIAFHPAPVTRSSSGPATPAYVMSAPTYHSPSTRPPGAYQGTSNYIVVNRQPSAPQPVTNDEQAGVTVHDAQPAPGVIVHGTYPQPVTATEPYMTAPRAVPMHAPQSAPPTPPQRSAPPPANSGNTVRMM
jgi:hypothetical protein